MKISSIALVLSIGLNCGIVFSSSTGVTQVPETTTNISNVTNSGDKNPRLKESLKGDENEIYNTEGETKNLDERSYVYIDQVMKRPLKKIYNLKLEKLTNTFMKEGFTSKRKINVFPDFQSQEQQQNQQQLYVPHIPPPKYGHHVTNKKTYNFQIQSEKTDKKTQKIKDKVPTEVKPVAVMVPRPVQYEGVIVQGAGINHKVYENQYSDHSKPKRKFPFARHRLNYNYGIASYPMRRSALRNQVRQNAEKDTASSNGNSYPANDKYVQLLEEIGNVIDLDVDDVMFENVNDNDNNNNKKICKNCYSIASVPKPAKSKTVSLLGCTCENINRKHEPFSKIMKMLDDKEQSTTDAASLDYSMK